MRHIPPLKCLRKKNQPFLYLESGTVFKIEEQLATNKTKLQKELKQRFAK